VDPDDVEQEPVGRARGAARPSKRRAPSKGASVPSAGSVKPPRHGRIDQQLSNDESVHFVVAFWTSVTPILAPGYPVEDRDPRIRAQADAYKDICAWLPQARLAPRVVAPLILVGNGASLGVDIWQSNPNGPVQRWWRRRLGPTVQPGYEEAV
jgi:hypothetical protein